MWKSARNARPSLLLGLYTRSRRLRIAVPSFLPALGFSPLRSEPVSGSALLSSTSASFLRRLYSTIFSEASNLSGNATATGAEHAPDVLPQYERNECMEEAAEDEFDWEEEEEVEPKIGDGGDGGGVVFGDLQWGERVLSIAQEALLQFDNDIKIFSFKATHKGYIYVRLDKLSNKYGCPSMDEIEEFNNLFKKKLDEAGEQGHIPMDLAVEVSSPGAERILKIPGDLERFRNLPMQVTYVADILESRTQQQVGVFLLESVETQTGYCTWKKADVKENRDALRKGRPLSRKQKEWRLRLPLQNLRLVKLYLQC